jgi:hypothetical protein
LSISWSSKKVLVRIILHPGKQGSARVDCSQPTEIAYYVPLSCFNVTVRDARESDILESIRLNYPFLSLLPNELINRQQQLLQGGTRPVTIKELHFMIIYSPIMM